MIGAGVSFPELVRGTGNWEEPFKWWHVVNIRASKKDPFCILTIKKLYAFAPNVKPLCLPEMINNKYDQIVHGAKVLGFGYNIDFEDHLKTWPNRNGPDIRKERRIETKKPLTARPSKQCALVFKTWALKNGYNIQGSTQYEWIEKYEDKKFRVCPKMYFLSFSANNYMFWRHSLPIIFSKRCILGENIFV